jgi:hypothetical protein
MTYSDSAAPTFRYWIFDPVGEVAETCRARLGTDGPYAEPVYGLCRLRAGHRAALQFGPGVNCAP